MDSDAIYKVARKYAIKNASDYGKAVEGPVISKLISEIPEAKGELAVVKDIVRKAIAEVNKLSSDEIKSFRNILTPSLQNRGRACLICLRNGCRSWRTPGSRRIPAAS